MAQSSYTAYYSSALGIWEILAGDLDGSLTVEGRGGIIVVIIVLFLLYGAGSRGLRAQKRRSSQTTAPQRPDLELEAAEPSPVARPRSGQKRRRHKSKSSSPDRHASRSGD